MLMDFAIKAKSYNDDVAALIKEAESFSKERHHATAGQGSFDRGNNGAPHRRIALRGLGFARLVSTTRTSASASSSRGRAELRVKPLLF